MRQRRTWRSVAGGGCILAALGISATAGADEPLHEIYFHDAARNRVGDTIIVQTNPETEILVFSGGELALEGGNLIVIARHARIDADTFIRSFTLAARRAKAGEPSQAPRGPDGAKDGDAGGSGAPGKSGATGDDGATAGKLVLRIGAVSGDGRLIVDLSGQGGGKGQRGGQGGDGGNGRNGREQSCGADDGRANGGDGGWGGIGGQGGQGGRGGSGGIVVYSEAMSPLIASRHLLIDTAAGRPGAGGDPGEAGNPGSGGIGGAGVMGCGNAGADGAQGGRTSGALPGSAGQPGGAGTAVEEETP
jgi:hypothetical protein